MINSDLSVSIVKIQQIEGINDYKFFCFDGRVEALFVATERQTREEPYFDFYDIAFNHLAIRQGHPNSPNPPEKPSTFDEMIQIASALSKGLPQARIDLYEVNGKVFFGEITFFHFGGVVPFHPSSIDEKWGRLINLKI